jgi:TonB family protein
MKILVFAVSLLSAVIVFSYEQIPSKSDHIDAFNEAQSCFNSVANTMAVRKIDCAKRALEEGRFIFESGSLNIAALTYNYGKALKRRDEKKALNILGESLELYEAIYGESSLEIINILIDMGESRKVKAIAKKYFEKDSVEYADILLELAMSNMLSLKDTSRYTDSALEIYLEKEGVESYNTAAASFQMGKVKFAQDKYKSAIPYLIGATKHPEVATFAHGWLVRAYGLTNQDDLASYHAEQLGRSRDGEGGSFVPVFIPTPDYPRLAQRRGVEGYAVVELTISKSGRATDILIVEEWPESYEFGEEALLAAERLLYAPRFIDGVAQEVTGVLYKYQFKMAR